MSSIAEQRKKYQQIIENLKNTPGAVFGGSLIQKDLDQLDKGGGYTVDSSGQVNLKNTGWGIIGGLTTAQKQQAAEAYNELEKLDEINTASQGRDLSKLSTYVSGGKLTSDNIGAAIRQFDIDEQNQKRDDDREYQAGLLKDERTEQERIRQAAALEAEKIRASNRLENTEARMFEQQMRNQDRALEREMRMFEMQEKGKGRKAELFKALFGLGTAFMI